MFKVPHQVYTAEFKEAAVQRVKEEVASLVRTVF
jgi:transposase-like protein